MLLYISIIGTPPQEVWPPESNISASQFGFYMPTPWKSLISKSSKEAVDLLSVSWVINNCMLVMD